MTEFTATVTRTVAEQDTAMTYGRDFPPVAATPFVLGLAEVACHNAVVTSLEDGELTVGTRAVIDHLAPSAVGVVLEARSSLRSRSGRRLVFDIEVFDGDSLVARVEHERAVVSMSQIERLVAKA